MNTDERFYPYTDDCDWEPLYRYLGTRDPEVCGWWMFMGAGTDGQRFYKHSHTRERLALGAMADAELVAKGERA